MPRKILICGNCQGDLIANVVRQIFANDPDLLVVYRPDYVESMRPEVGSLLATADDVFLQRAMFAAPWLQKLIPGGARVHYFPAMRLSFMWPDGDQTAADHKVDNSPLADLAGSSVIGKLREEPGSPEAKIERYLAADIAAEHHAERLMRMDRITMNHLARDTDLDLWGPLETSFRQRRPHFSSLHPDWPLLEPVARYVTDVIGGADPDRTEAIINRHADENYFARTVAPVHPSIARMFDLRWAEADYHLYTIRYGYADSGGYCKLYLAPSDFADYGIYHAARAAKQYAAAIDTARRILHRGIGRPSCIHFGLAEMLSATGQPDAARGEAGRLPDLYPSDVQTMLRLAALAQRCKDFALAERALGTATAIAGADNTSVLRARLGLAGATGDKDGACALAQRILSRDSLSSLARQTLGMAVENEIEGSHWQWRASPGRRQWELDLWHASGPTALDSRPPLEPASEPARGQAEGPL